MAYIISINTLTDGRFSIETLSRLSGATSLVQVSRRMADLAVKHFGDQATHRKDKSLLGYWAHRKTGQTIEVDIGADLK